MIVHGNNREHCILRLKQAIHEMVIEPIASTLELHKEIFDTKEMNDANDIKWLENIFLRKKE